MQRSIVRPLHGRVTFSSCQARRSTFEHQFPTALGQFDQVADDELATALYGYIHDSIGVNQDELTAGVARLFGWNRRGNGIQARLDDLILRLLNQGYLQGNREGLSLDPSRGKQ